jgi:hypothetical protein
MKKNRFLQQQEQQKEQLVKNYFDDDLDVDPEEEAVQ